MNHYWYLWWCVPAKAFGTAVQGVEHTTGRKNSNSSWREDYSPVIAKPNHHRFGVFHGRRTPQVVPTYGLSREAAGHTLMSTCSFGVCRRQTPISKKRTKPMVIIRLCKVIKWEQTYKLGHRQRQQPIARSYHSTTPNMACIPSLTRKPRNVYMLPACFRLWINQL